MFKLMVEEVKLNVGELKLGELRLRLGVLKLSDETLRLKLDSDKAPVLIDVDRRLVRLAPSDRDVDRKALKDGGCTVMVEVYNPE